jgi:diadenosine tetraphosphate (Ap4A) HIT family hydrolase
VLRTPRFRIIHADEAGYPGFYRLVWNAHVAEVSDLPKAERDECFTALVEAERLMRQHLAPRKVNLATLGNMVPHLHWHLVARYDWDPHFPAPVWAAPVREAAPDQLATLQERLAGFEQALKNAFAT